MSNPIDLTSTAQDGNTRPYRSHRYPACARCRTRRTRCTIDRPNQSCLLCRMHGFPCTSTLLKKPTLSRVGAANQVSISKQQEHSTHQSGGEITKPNVDEDNHMIGPIVSRDTQIVDRYLPQSTSTSTAADIEQAFEIKNIGSKASSPVYRAPVPRPRPNHLDQNLETTVLLEQIRPIYDKLVQLYTEHLHPCLPLFDENTIKSVIKSDDMVSENKTLLINFTAYTSFYWSLSPALHRYHRPDQDLLWQYANVATSQDRQKSNLNVIISLILDIAGRPSTGFVINGNNTARQVSLAHAIGLNRDCGNWDIPEKEKRLRQRAWWAILIHDQWFNFAKGTPALIVHNQYNVPVPAHGLLISKTFGKSENAAECYVQLCRLTEILGGILPVIYDLRTQDRSVLIDNKFESWIHNCPDWLLDLENVEPRSHIAGLANLQLSYLAVKMLICRINCHEGMAKSNQNDSKHDMFQNSLIACSEAAKDMMRFTLSLTPHDLASFWLPYNALHFTSAVTLLLRCGLQIKSPIIRQQSFDSARTLVNTLKTFRSKYHWDMAVLALPQSERMLNRVEAGLAALQHPTDQPPGKKTHRQYRQNRAANTRTNRRSRSEPEAESTSANTSTTTNSHLNHSQPVPSLNSTNAHTSPLYDQDILKDLFPELFSDLSNDIFMSDNLSFDSIF